MPHGLNAALDELERRLADRPGEDPDVAALARVAATSEYHVRRMFSALAGMPLGEYVRRRRATLAAAAVVAGREPLLDVAVRFGYGSTEAFGRAFRAVHGVLPGEARRTGATLSGQQRLSFRVVVEGSSVMEYRVVQSGRFRLVGARARVPLVHQGLNPSIVDFLRGLPAEVRERVGSLSDGEPAGPLNVSDGLGSDRAEGTELDYWFAAARHGEHAAVEEGLDSLDVPEGSWAVFSVTGPFPAVVQELWRDVFTQWFPSNPWRSRPGPEMLRNELSDDGATTRAELWIPVEPTGP
jgi:AraC family transcriptional regulator